MRWVERYENDDNIKRHNREAISYKVKKTHVKFVLDELKKNKTLTIEILLSMLKDKFKDLELSRRQTKIYINFRLLNKNNLYYFYLTFSRYN